MLTLPGDDRIKLIFPTALYVVDELLDEEQNDTLAAFVLELAASHEGGGSQEWKSGADSPRNCYQTLDLHELPECAALTANVLDAVQRFAAHFGSRADYGFSRAWYNVYGPGQFQEHHVHKNNVFSAVYYCRAPEGSAPTWFKSYDLNGMSPYAVEGETELNREDVALPAVERRLVVFRSSLLHMVPPGHHTEPRITMSFNLR